MLLTYCEGRPADGVIEQGVDAGRVLYEVGVNLAKLHQVAPTPQLRSFEQSGACNLGDHVADRWSPLFAASPHTAAHPFVLFYQPRLKSLQVGARLCLDLCERERGADLRQLVEISDERNRERLAPREGFNWAGPPSTSTKHPSGWGTTSYREAAPLTSSPCRRRSWCA
jgi:hypothetical protein